jgi:hypothetical protein
VFGIGAGETLEFIPGSSAELELELDPLRYVELGNYDENDEMEWRPHFLIKLSEVRNY